MTQIKWIIIGVIAILVAVSLMPPTRQEGREVSGDMLSDFLFMAAFTDDCKSWLSALENCQKTTARWDGEIRYFIVGNFQKETHNKIFELTVARVFEQISINTGISFASGKEDVNFILYILDAKTVEQIYRARSHIPFTDVIDVSQGNFPCLVRGYIEENTIIHGSIIFNEKLNDEMIEECVFEEIFNSVGIFADPPGYNSVLRKYPLVRQFGIQNRGGYKKNYPPELQMMLQLYYCNAQPELYQDHFVFDYCASIAD